MYLAELPTPLELREIARVWDESAEYCAAHCQSYPELARRDAKIARALRFVADKIELELVGGEPG